MSAKNEYERWMKLKAAADAQWDVVTATARLERGIDVGDLVQIGSKRGRVKFVRVQHCGWTRGPELEVTVFAMPLKKNGEAAAIGEMREWRDSQATLIEKAKP